VKRSYVKIAREIADVLEGKVGKTADLMACKQVPTVYLTRWILALAPPQRRKAPTKCSLTRKANRATTAQLDELWKEIIRKRDGALCRRCKKDTRLQVHHIMSRRHQKLKWMTSNGMVLCAGCHLWVHGRTGASTMEISRWLEAEIGARELLRLEAAKQIRGKPQDHNLVKLLLEKEMRP